VLPSTLFVFRGKRSVILTKISTMFSLTKNQSSSGIILVLCNKKFKNLEFGISVGSSVSFFSLFSYEVQRSAK